MHKIDAPSATPTNEFTDGDPSTGIVATELIAKWHNTIQRELVALVEGAGLTLDDTDDTQIAAAVAAISQALITIHAALTGTHGATATPTANRIAMFGANALMAGTPMHNLIWVRDEKAAGTHAGAAAAGDNLRDLNTVHYNSITGALLSSHRIRLPAGTYLAMFASPMFGNTSRHRAKLINQTAGTNLIHGSSGSTTGNSFTSYGIGLFTLAAQSYLRVSHYITSAVSTFGLGHAAGDGANEVYTEVVIFKLV